MLTRCTNKSLYIDGRDIYVIFVKFEERNVSRFYQFFEIKSIDYFSSQNIDRLNKTSVTISLHGSIGFRVKYLMFACIEREIKAAEYRINTY